MGFKVKKTKKQRIVGAISFIIFAFVMFCIIYFLTYFFTLTSSTHEGQKIVESDWQLVIGRTGEYVYSPEYGVIFSFKDNGRFSIETEEGDKIASGFYKLKLDDFDKGTAASGTLKLLTVPFAQDFPEEWEFGELRNDFSFRFIYSQKDRDGNIMYQDDDYNVMSDTMEITTEGALFTLVREGSEEAEAQPTEREHIYPSKAEE